MPQDDSFWARKRRQEEREEQEAEDRAEEEKRKAKLAALKGGGAASAAANAAASSSTSISFDEIIRRAPILMDQLEHLYRQYAVGVLARPPIEERMRLDQMIVVLTNSAKASAADRFKFSGVFNSYTTHKARWDKLLADVESGKIKRVAGPKKGPQRL